jgi:hypothetical protein
MGNLRNWLQTRNEGNVLGKTLAHMQKVLECVVEFERGFTFFAKEHNTELALEVFTRVSVLEHEADTIRREVLLLIVKSDLETQIREDLATLVRRIDRIANAANGAARRLGGIDEISIRSLGEEFLTRNSDIIHFSVEATKILYNLTKKLPEIENKDVFRITGQIQALEHKCDVLHADIYKYLNKLKEVSFNPFTAIEIANFVDLVESISDKVEDVADFIELLKTSLR